MPIPVYGPVHGEGIRHWLHLTISQKPCESQSRVYSQFGNLFLLLRVAVPACSLFLWHGYLTSKNGTQGDGWPQILS